MKCKREICKIQFDKINSNNKLKIEKKKLEKKKDMNDIDKLVNSIYSNIDQKEFNLCLYKNCKIYKQIQEERMRTLKENLIEHDIKLSSELQKKFDNLIELVNKPLLNDEEYIKSIILYQIIQKFINIKIDEHIKHVFDIGGIFEKCSNKNCKNLSKEVINDEELRKKKLSIISLKDEKKRNEIIRDIYSNEKQIKLDKCNVNSCNKDYLNLLGEMIKLYNKKIKKNNIKIPDDIKIPNLNKIDEADIPEIIIKFNQLKEYVGYL